MIFGLLMLMTPALVSGFGSGLHLFVDLDGVSSSKGLELRQHTPTKTYEMAVQPTEPWDGAGPLPGLIEGYCSVVQDPKNGEIRIFYDTFGEYGRFLCVAVSKDGGKTFTKPKLGLKSFMGSTENNIVLGKEENSTALAESIEPGTVFIDTNPSAPASERWKMVVTWEGGASMFASADGFEFKNMTAKPSLTGSDSQDVVFWDARAAGGKGAYVYYGRSHLKGGQSEPCVGGSGPGRSINHFVIGDDVIKWPYSSANSNATELCVLNTDTEDPPCIDIYTNVATQLGDAYFFFPMMYNHFSSEYAQGRGNDGLLEARMAVSRDGNRLKYISRKAWLTRGEGEHRVNHTGVYEGAFDGGSNAVVRGLVQTETETLLYGWGSQYTHGGYVGFTKPPARGQSDAIKSGIQTLRLRKNGFVSLAPMESNGFRGGSFKTKPFALPACAKVLQLNICTSIGLGASVNISDGATGKLLAVSSNPIEGGSVAWNVSWSTMTKITKKHWHDDGCAYEAPAPIDSCAKGSAYLKCKTVTDCCQGSPLKCPPTGTCQDVRVDCKKGICANGKPGGEACGHIVSTPQLELVGTDLRKLKLPKTVVLDVAMGGGSDLYSTEFIC